MMLTFTSPERQIDKLRKLLGESSKQVGRNVATALNATGKLAKSQIAKEITTELATPQKIVKQQISATKAAGGNLSVTITLKKTNRMSLRFFGARQTKKGVSYKVSKSKGRKFVPGAFQGPRPGVMKASWKGNVFKRVGTSRLPIQKLQGPSPWGVFVKKKAVRKVEKLINVELKKQLDRRIRFLTLKAQGKI
jgi:hypothetical protein